MCSALLRAFRSWQQRAVVHNDGLFFLIQRKRERFAELEREIADPELFSNRKRAQDLMRERAGIEYF